MTKGKHVDFHYLVTYNDSSDLPRAWGKAPTEEAADTEAKRQREAYKAKRAELGEPAEEYTRKVQQCSTERVDPVRPGLAKTIGPEGRRKRAPSTAAANGPKTAKAGDDLTPKALRKLRKLTRLEIPGTVQPKPKGELDPTRGQWVCIDCGDPMQNNMQAHGHTKTHRLGWWTGVHVEEP